MTIPEPFNTTLVGNNTSGIVSLFQTVNQNFMEGWFGTLIVFAIFALSFILMQTKANDNSVSFITSTIITMFASIMLRILELVPDVVVYSIIVVAAFAVGVNMKS